MFFQHTILLLLLFRREINRNGGEDDEVYVFDGEKGEEKKVMRGEWDL